MLQASLGYKGGITAPQRTAALAGYDILKEGGTAIEAIIGAAATVAVTYPHMNGIGGDAFWIIKKSGQKPIGIAGCGYAASKATAEWLKEREVKFEIPTRGGISCLTVPGAIASWEKALSLVEKPMRLSDLLANAIGYANDGFAVTANQSICTQEKFSELKKISGFSETFLNNNLIPEPGFLLKQKSLGNTLENLSKNGLNDFYRGDIARIHSQFLSKNGSPLSYHDLANFRAEFVEPVTVKITKGNLYNLPAPTQGISSLMILALYDKLNLSNIDTFTHIHSLVEITKRVFLKRNRELGDPRYMNSDVKDWLKSKYLEEFFDKIDFSKVLPWHNAPKKGDTIWMGAIDKEGTAVSFIQSVFWEFGSGLVCPDTGVFFQNRGAGFSLESGPNKLLPGKKPFHTLNPALALLNDGREMVYGTMGGDGQPQTQSAIFSRYAYFDYDLQRAISLPRWLLGKTWGQTGTTLKLEARFDKGVIDQLKVMGHHVEIIDDFSDLVGHAGALVKNHDGLIEGASDPRADGFALTF